MTYMYNVYQYAKKKMKRKKFVIPTHINISIIQCKQLSIKILYRFDMYVYAHIFRR